MTHLSTPVLLALFTVAAVVTWLAGLRLSTATDALDNRLQLGEALGGVVLLAIAGSLPEVAITASAAAAGHLALASGNLIGGIAVQTLVLVCDAVPRARKPLSFLAGSLIPVFEALLAIVTVSVTIAGGLLPASSSIGGVLSPASCACCRARWALVSPSPSWSAWAPASFGLPGSRPCADGCA